MYLVHDGPIVDAGHTEHACRKPGASAADGDQITVETPDVQTVADQLGGAKWRRPADFRVATRSLIFSALGPLFVAGIDRGDASAYEQG